MIRSGTANQQKSIFHIENIQQPCHKNVPLLDLCFWRAVQLGCFLNEEIIQKDTPSLLDQHFNSLHSLGTSLEKTATVTAISVVNALWKVVLVDTSH